MLSQCSRGPWDFFKKIQKEEEVLEVASVVKNDEDYVKIEKLT